MEEEEQLEIITDTLLNLHFESDRGEDHLRPIDSEDAREARRTFVREYYCSLSSSDQESVVRMAVREAQREQRQLTQPNLEVPVGQQYVYRAQ